MTIQSMNKKILLVEDEKMIREMYEIVLKHEGYDVDFAEDGEIAVQKLSQPKPDYDLVLLDLMMPKLDGINVLKIIKAPDSPSRHIPVFLLTNLGMDNLIKEAMSHGADKFLVKANYLPKQVVDEITAFLKVQPLLKVQPRL